MKSFPILLTSILSLLCLNISAQEVHVSPIMGEQGSRVYQTWDGNSSAYHGKMTSDDHLLIGGYGYWSGCNCFNITMAKLDTICGALDPSFSDDGILSIRHEGRSVMHDFYLTEDERIIGAGQNSTSNSWSQHKPAIYRFLADGTPDTTLYGTGFRKAPFTSISSGNFVRVFPAHDGRILAAGFSASNINGGVNGIGVMRFLENGDLDPTYSGDGMSMLNLAAYPGVFHGGEGRAVMLSDSSIVFFSILNVNSVDRIGLTKFDSQGNIDTSVGDNGLWVTDILTTSYEWQAMGVQTTEDDRIYLSSAHPTDNSFQLTRFLPSCELDSLYGTDGTSSVAIGSGPSPATGIELLPDGSTLQYGFQNWNNGNARIVKRDADGNLDTSFSDDGVAAPSIPTFMKFNGAFQVAPSRFIGWGYGAEIAFFKFVADPDAERFLDLGPDLSICAGDSVTLDAGAGMTSYVWNTEDSTQFLTASVTGTYSVTVTDEDECHDTDELQLDVLPAPAVPFISADGFELSTDAVGVLQWYLDGEAIDGATAAIHMAIENGEYSVAVTDGNGCSAFSSTILVTGTSLPDLHELGIDIFPNPCQDYFYIETASPIQSMELVDARGRIIPVLRSPNGMVDVSGMDIGLYTLRLLIEGTPYAHRIMVR